MICKLELKVAIAAPDSPKPNEASGGSALLQEDGVVVQGLLLPGHWGIELCSFYATDEPEDG